MSLTPFTLVLENSYMLTPNVKHFIFRRADQQIMSFIPGQFITIHLEHPEKTYRRSYSIANVPTNHNIIEFAASYIPSGIASELLFNLKPGDQLNTTGPFGRLILKEDNPKRYILVATGTGVTPYRAMRNILQQKLDADPNLHIVILQGSSTSKDVLYGDEFLNWTQQSSRVMFRSYLSKETNLNLEKNEFKGYVQNAFSELNLNPAQDLIYLCGNPGMIDDSFEQLKNYGFESQHIIREKYISSK
jgi:ferredoxin-NADP reductase